MRLVTISPVPTPLILQPGVDPRSEFYKDIVEALPRDDERVSLPRTHDGSGVYENLEEDGYDLRLLEYRTRIGNLHADLCLHVYPTGTSIAEIHLDRVESGDAGSLEQLALDRSREVIESAEGELQRLFSSLARAIPGQYLSRGTGDSPGPLRTTWVARALLLSPDEMDAPDTGNLLRAWLKHTTRPEDADDLLQGNIDHSMTWVNYVIVDGDPDRTRMLLAAMRISQFFYASQETLNNRTQATISEAYFTKDPRGAQKRLIDARTRMQMLRIQFGVQMKFLNRGKRYIVDRVLKSWDFDDLVANGARMSEASSARINELTSRRREFSTVITDFILVAIGFLVIIDVALSLTEYSREVMSRPVLEYTDSGSSLILSYVASIDVDLMLLGGTVIILLLTAFYGYYKFKK